MTEPARSTRLWEARAPTAADVDELAQAAYAALPTAFRNLCEELVIQVVDFPDEETLEQMNAASEFDLLGLFRGRGLPHRSAFDGTGALPNTTRRYRRPLLGFWCEGENTLDAVAAPEQTHEIRHHIGLSDADMEAIEASAG